MLRMAYVNVGRVDKSSLNFCKFSCFTTLFSRLDLANKTLFLETQKQFTWEVPLPASLLKKLIFEKARVAIESFLIPPEGGLTA